MQLRVDKFHEFNFFTLHYLLHVQFTIFHLHVTFKTFSLRFMSSTLFQYTIDYIIPNT